MKEKLLRTVVIAELCDEYRIILVFINNIMLDF